MPHCYDMAMLTLLVIARRLRDDDASDNDRENDSVNDTMTGGGFVPVETVRGAAIVAGQQRLFSLL